MEKITATKLVESERCHSHSRESDTVIARRAERAHLEAGFMFIGIAVISLIDHGLNHQLTTFRVFFFYPTILVFGIILSYRGYRFRRARKLLSDTKTDSHNAA